MRHRVSGRHLNRTASHRKALRRNLAASLFQHGAIRTTEAKAKELRRFVEKLITTASKGTLHARRQILAKLGDRQMVDDEGTLDKKSVVQKLFDEIAPRYADRPGGYTRIIRLSDRRIGDSGKQVLLQLVGETTSHDDDSSQAAPTSRRKRRTARRLAAAADTVDTTQETEPAEKQVAPAEQAEPVEAVEPAEDQPTSDDEEKQSEPS